MVCVLFCGCVMHKDNQYTLVHKQNALLYLSGLHDVKYGY